MHIFMLFILANHRKLQIQTCRKKSYAYHGHYERQGLITQCQRESILENKGQKIFANKSRVYKKLFLVFGCLGYAIQQQTTTPEKSLNTSRNSAERADYTTEYGTRKHDTVYNALPVQAPGFEPGKNAQN